MICVTLRLRFSASGEPAGECFGEEKNVFTPHPRRFIGPQRFPHFSYDHTQVLRVKNSTVFDFPVTQGLDLVLSKGLQKRVF